jgi:hypothetical protein
MESVPVFDTEDSFYLTKFLVYKLLIENMFDSIMLTHFFKLMVAKKCSLNDDFWENELLVNQPVVVLFLV